MAVQVSDICDRCGRATPVQLDNDQLVVETEKRKNIEANVRVLEDQVRAMDPALLPTLFVAYKSADGTMLVKSQIGICSPAGDGKRSCTKRVAELINDLFPLPAEQRAPRSARKSKDPEKNGAKGAKK